MRILQVRFKNLNSLVGEWEIDLMHPAFAALGAYSLVGPEPIANSAISMPVKSNVSRSFVFSVVSP